MDLPMIWVPPEKLVALNTVEKLIDHIRPLQLCNDTLQFLRDRQVNGETLFLLYENGQFYNQIDVRAKNDLARLGEFTKRCCCYMLASNNSEPGKADGAAKRKEKGI